MSLWQQVISHPSFERIKMMYNELLPLEVRYVCADWIEKQMICEQFVDINDIQIDQRATEFVNLLRNQLLLRIQDYQRSEDMSIKYRLEDTLNSHYNNSYKAFQIYKKIRETLQIEQHLVSNFNGDNTMQMNNLIDNEALEIDNAIAQLDQLTQATKEKYEQYLHDIENYSTYVYTEVPRLMSQFQQQLPNDLDREMRQLETIEKCNRNKSEMLQKIHNLSAWLSQNIAQNIVHMEEVQKIVICNRLSRWQQNQVSAGNGAPLPINSLEDIQKWFEKLFYFHWSMRTLVQKICSINVKYQINQEKLFEESKVKIASLLTNLVVTGFVVEKQPPQVMKTNTRFSSTVRFLITNANIELNSPPVYVSILSEHQAQIQQTNTLPIEETAGDILNNTGNLELQTTGGRHLSCNLRTMQLKKIKRAEKKGTESVMDEKFTLLFKSTFQCSDVRINVWVMSLPVVVIVHGNQEPQSWATIIWDNAFGEIGRIPFYVADRVPWPLMANALNTKFTSQTGRALTNENINYLCEKVFRSPINFNVNERPITWSMFCKDPMPDRTFTFWDWFYSVMRLTRDHLRGPWKEGLINGFINKKQAEEMLLKCDPGTFLLRFSDSEIGGITIAYVELNVVDQTPHIVMVQPFSHKDFAIRSLGDRIMDLSQCVTLYPNSPKKIAFGSYYTPVAPSNGGYVHTSLITTIPGKEEKPVVVNHYNMPSTSNYMQSPDYHRDTPSAASFNSTQMPENTDMYLSSIDFDETLMVYN